MAVFEIIVCKALNNGKIEEEEFNALQTLQLESLNNLSNVDHKMESENRSKFEKVYCKKSTT